MKRLCLVPAVLLFTCVLLVHPCRARAQRTLSLADAVALARRNSTSVRQADLEIERARLKLLKQRLAWVDLRAVASALSLYQAESPLPPSCVEEPGGCPAGVERADLTLALKVPFFTGFRLEAELARARIGERQSLRRRKRALRDLQRDVTRAYWEVRRRELVLATLERLQPRFHELDTFTRARVRAGLAPLVDSDRTRASLLALTEQRMAAERDLELARADLSVLLETNEPLVLTDDPLRYRATLPSLQEALDQSAKNRHELAEAHHDIEAADQAVRSARSGYWPQLAFVAQERAQVVGQPGGDGGGLYALPSHDFYVGLQLSWTAFDMLDTWTRVKDATLQKERSVAGRAERRHQVRTDVYVAHAQLTEALARTRPTELAVALARQDADLLRKRDEAGSVSVFELIDAHDRLLRSELEVVNRAIDGVEADASLRAARGDF